MNENPNVMPPLVSYRNLSAMETFWHQTDDGIIIKVNITDHQQCDIAIKQNLVHVLAEFESAVCREILLNLFGAVIVKESQFRVRGNFLVIDLVKGVRREWPSLLYNDQKVLWLKYNYDAMENIIDEGLITNV